MELSWKSVKLIIKELIATFHNTCLFAYFSLSAFFNCFFSTASICINCNCQIWKCILDNFPVQRVHFHLTLTSCVHSALLFASKSVCFHLGDGNTCLRNHFQRVNLLRYQLREGSIYKFLRNPTDSVCAQLTQLWFTWFWINWNCKPHNS